jgi:hypothetical protein
MQDLPPSDPRPDPNRSLDWDERIAIIVVILVFGSIFTWAFTRKGMEWVTGLSTPVLEDTDAEVSGIFPFQSEDAEPSETGIAIAPRQARSRTEGDAMDDAETADAPILSLFGGQAERDGSPVPDVSPDEAIPTPDAEASPEATPIPTDSPQASPSPSPEATPTPTESPQASPSPSPEAEETLEASPSPSPEAEESPEATPTPTESPQASPSPSPEAEESPSPDITLEPEATETTEEPVEFADIPQQFWARPYIQEVAQRGIVNGYPDRTFRPDNPVTRSEFAVFLDKTFELQSKQEAIVYQDVPSIHWAQGEIQKATEGGFLTGDPETTFRPDDRLSRLEVLLALSQGLELQPPDNVEQVLQQNYEDVEAIPEKALSSVAAATQAGFVYKDGEARRLRPDESATRAEVVALLYQALVIEGEVEPSQQ